ETNYCLSHMTLVEVELPWAVADIDRGPLMVPHPQRRLRPPAYADPPKGAGEVRFDGPLGDAEPPGNLFVRNALAEQRQDVAFTAGELLGGGRRSLGHEGRRRPRGKRRRTLRRGVDGGHDLLGVVIREQVAAGTGIDRR